MVHFLCKICLILAFGLMGVFLLGGCEEEDEQGTDDTSETDEPQDGSDSNSDLQDTEPDGGNNELYPTEDLWPEVDSLLVGDSLFGLCIGTNKDFREHFFGTHSLHVQPVVDQAAAYQDAKSSKIEDVFYGVINYTAADPTNVEDPNQQNVICASTILMYDWENYWHWYEDYDTYEDFKFNMAMLLLDRVEADMGLDFASHIEVMEVFTPHTMHGFSLNPGGSVFGWAMIPEQSVQKRMPQQTPIDNLLLAGAWTYPGGGQSVSIISGMLAGMKIDMKDGQQIPTFAPHDPPLRGINAEWFDNLGIKNMLEIECSDILYAIRFNEMCDENRECQFTIPADPEEYRIWLKNRYPEDADGIDRLFQKLYDINKVMRILFKYEYSGKDVQEPDVMGEMVAEVSAAGENLLDILTNDLLAMMEGMTLTEFLTPYTTNTELISFFTHLAGMAGEGPDAVDAIFFIAMWNNYHLGGFCYVHGGSQAISDALATKIRTKNKVRLNSLVTKIDIDNNGKASRVRTADGTCYETRYVVSNANAPDTFFKMVGYHHLPTPEISDDPLSQFHPGRIWQPPIGETPSKPVGDVRTGEGIDQLTGATPEVSQAKLTSSHAGWAQAGCIACHGQDAHPVPALGNNAPDYTDAQCTTCHGNNGSPIATAKNHSSDNVGESCGSCHAAVHGDLAYQAPADCRACHKFNDSDPRVGDAPECAVTEEGYDVVVIGAGAGGLGAGAYLTMRGYNVVVLERHHKVGGYMTNFQRGPYRIEVSTHGFDALDPRPDVDWNVPEE